MGKQKAPPAPDYAAAAAAQGTANLEAAQYTAAINRPTQTDSNGTQSWTLKPGADPKNPQPGDWQVTTALNPQQQALKDQQDRLSAQYGDLASGALGTIGSTMNTKFDTSGLPQASALSANGLNAYGSAPSAIQGSGVGGPAFHEGITANSNAQYAPGVSGRTGALGMAVHDAAPGAAIHEGAPEVNANRNDLSTQGLSAYGNVAPTTEGSRQRITDALYSRSRAMLDPQTQQQSSDLTSRLAAQGITEGSEAFNRAQDNQARQQSETYANARNDAILAGGAEDSRIGAQNLNVAGFQNSTRGQQFGEKSAVAEMGNRNLDSLFTQGLASASFNNASRDTNWQQDYQKAGFDNASRDTNYQQGMQSAGFENANRDAMFSQGLARAGFDNSVGKDDFAQRLAAMQANNTSRDTNFNQGLASQQFNNEQMQQYFQNQMAAAGFQNSTRGQQFGEQQAMTGMNNTLHQNAIQEALMQRQLPMNEANALRTGVQVGAPNFQQYGGGGQVGAAPIYQSVNDRYANQIAATNAANAGAGGMMSGLGQLGIAGASMYMASDRRLKKNIERIGTHKLGIGLYKYDYIWDEPAIGVMADELIKVMPEAVVVNSAGYQMVNYGMLEGV